MKKLTFILVLSSMVVLTGVFSSCNKKSGCTDQNALNYDPDAKKDDGSCQYAQDTATIILQGSITSNTTLKGTRKYLLKGFVYVESGATLTIEPGCIIKGDKDTKGSLIIKRGGKIMAVGTAQKPIVFTSNKPIGQRDYGDWGGIIICGKAPVNLPGGEGLIEGGPDAYYGGNDPNDNSGKLKYVRIEFAGIAFQPNQEINGLTLAGVGNATEIDFVQVSYNGDDAFEFFGGTVNVKHLISFRNWDDDFDTDNGWSGKAQFCFALRDPNIADQSGSNGFESDNDAQGTQAQPYTSGIFSNVTILGPISPSNTNFNSQFKRSAHLRRNTKLKVYNSVLVGYPVGLLIDGSAAETNAQNGELVFKNNIIAGCTTPLAVASNSTFDIQTWFNAQGQNNQIVTNISDLQLNTNAWNLTNPSLLPQTNSPLLNGASFTYQDLQNSFFDVVNFKGAFGTTNWASGWANFDPQNTQY
ncbi:MAG: hypothetical protein N2449_08440 [Bacteroidales bacterium]|nr:hypothetical protein [Bacteroidales bacterium]